MRALVYPQHGYIADNVASHLKRLGHEVLLCHDGAAAEGQHGPDAADAAWSAALQQADAVFHVLHGHEQHAREALLALLQCTTPQAPVTFIGISTPLTWAATSAPPHVATPSTAAAAAATPAAAAATPAAAAATPAAAGEVQPLSAAAVTGEASAAAGTTQQQDTGAARAEAAAADAQPSTGCLSADDAPKRRPAASAVSTFHAEELVLRCHRPGRLHTAVVCPGVLYGAGEDDDQLHLLWKAAWEGKQPLQLHGSGLNRLPTLHVHDLAAFCEALALQQQQQQADAQVLAQQQLLLGAAAPRAPSQQQGRYLLAVDAQVVTQRQLVEGVGQLLVHGDVRSASPSLLAPPTSPLVLLDLPLACSSLSLQYARTCPHGLMAHLSQVLQELVAARNLSPLRILIRGPPASGKTHLGLRLAQLYGLLYINPAVLLKELQHVDADTQQAANAQLAGREGRLSQQLMAKLAQHLLLRHPTALKQGWVLEGWPRSLSAAVLMSTVSAASSGGGSSSSGGSAAGGAVGGGPAVLPGPAGDGSKGGRRESVASAGVKDKRRSTGGPAVLAAAGGRGRRTACEEDIAARCPQGLSLQSPELLPHVLIELEVAEEELQRRVKALAAAEAAAAAAAAAEAAAAKAAAAGPGARKAGGAVGSSGSVSGLARATSGLGAASAAATAAAAAGATGPFAAAHNNMKDWGRRMEAYRQLLQEDATDLAAKKSAVVSAYQAQLAAEAAAAAAAAAEEPQAAAAVKHSARQSGGDTKAAGVGGGSSRLTTPRHQGGTRASAGGCWDGAAQLLPPGMKLPEHGGFTAYFADAGAKCIKLANPLDNTVAAAVPFPSPSRAASPRLPHRATAVAAALPPLAAAEQQLMQEIGSPHNYDGFPQASAEAWQGVSGGPAAAAAAGVDGAVGPASTTEAVQAQGSDGISSAAGLGGMQAAAGGGSTAAPAGGSRPGGGGGAGSTGQQQQPQAPAAGVAGAAAAAAMQQLQPDLQELQQAAEVLATEAAARHAQRVSEAARPLAAALMESLVGDLMAGLVDVALRRPDDPCKVVADKLLSAAAAQQAAYVDPYADPVYAIQLAKVEAKASREAARAAAAAAKAAREQAAAANAAASAGESSGGTAAGVVTAAAAATTPDSHACGPATTTTAAGAAAAGSKHPAKEHNSSEGTASAPAGSHKQGGRAAGGRASVAHGGAQPSRQA